MGRSEKWRTVERISLERGKAAMADARPMLARNGRWSSDPRPPRSLESDLERAGESSAELVPSAAPLPQRQAELLALQRIVGNQTVQRLLVAEFPVPSVQRAVGSNPLLLQRKLIDDFTAKFKDAGALVSASSSGMKLVEEADKAGVKFGGYAEDGPGKSAWPYTIGDTVYIPKAHTDKITAMSDFLFELNNAVRQPKFADIHAKAAKGNITPKEYARQKVALEVEGMLRLGKIWFESKKSIGGKDLDKHDGEFYLAEYTAVKNGKKSESDIVDDVLKRKYTEGADAGKTVEQFYMEQAEALSPKK